MGFVVGMTDDPGPVPGHAEEDTMNPTFNWAIVAERMQAVAAEADTAARARHAARIRRRTVRAVGPPLPPGAGVRPKTISKKPSETS